MTSLPANWVNVGYGVPNVCARHGEPAVRRAKTQFVSKPPSWALPLVVFGGIVYFIVVMAVRKTITVQTWPFCERCRGLKLRLLLGGLGALLVGIVLLIIASGLMADDAFAGIGALLILAPLVLVLAGVVMMARSNRTVIAGGVVTNDGLFIELAKADSRFAAEIEAASVYAEQQARYQQQQQQAQYQQHAGYPQQPPYYPPRG
jgi:hypothetical protein